MPKKTKPISLPEKDYLAILDTIKSFNQCNTRSDLKECFKDVLLPLFEAQSSTYAWTDTEIKSPQAIDIIGMPEKYFEVQNDFLRYDPIAEISDYMRMEPVRNDYYRETKNTEKR